MKKKIERNILGLIANNSFHNMITIYVNTFLVAYLLNISAGNFFNVALYYVIAYSVMIVSYSFFSFIICKFKKIHIMRGAILLSCVMLGIIAFLQENIVNFLVPISLVYNLCNGMYWSANNSLSNELIKGKKLQSYNTYNSVVSSITSIIVPVVFGGIIDSSSLFIISIFATIVGLLQIATTFILDIPKHSPHNFDLKGYYDNCYNKGHKTCFNLLFLGYFFYGLKDAISVLITILIVLSFKTNTSLGAISSLISCLTIFILIFTNKWRSKRNATMFLATTCIAVTSVFLLMTNINKITIIFFNIAYSSLLAINNRSFAVKRSGLIRAIDKKDYIVEHQAVSELFLNIGRTIFYSILLIASFSNNVNVYRTILAISVSFIALFGIFSYFLEKEYQKILIEREFKKQINRMIEDHEYFIPCYSNPYPHNETNLR